MKLTTNMLKQIIKEELNNVLKEEKDPFSGDTKTAKPPGPGEPGYDPFSGDTKTAKPDADEEAENLARLQKRSNALAQVEKVLSNLVQKIK